MDIQEYNLFKTYFPKFEYVVDNSRELLLRFDKVVTLKDGDVYETPVSDHVKIKICKFMDESNFPVTLKKLLPDSNVENELPNTYRVKNMNTILARGKAFKHDNVSLIIVSSDARMEVSDIDCTKVFIASGEEDEAEMANYIKEKGNCKDTVTQIERIAQDVGDLLAVIALKPLKRKCEKLSYFLHDNETQSAFQGDRKRLKLDAVRPVELPTSSVSRDVDKAACESLLEEMLALYEIINIPDSEKPVVQERMEVDVNKELCQTVFAISPTIKRMGYRYSKFYIYAVEIGDYADIKKRNREIDKVMKKHKIYDYEIAPCTENIKEFSYVGAKIEARSDTSISVRSTRSSPFVRKRGTLGCFVNLKDRHGRLGSTPGVVLSRHVAKHCSDLYHISDGSDRKLGSILQETCQDEHGSLDIAAAEMHVTPGNTKFKNSTEDNLPGKLHTYEGEDTLVRRGRKVHIWGATSRPGYGIITAAKVIYDGMNDPLIQIEDKDATEGTRFAKEGDSGAIVCADDPEKKCVHALAMIVGTPTPEHYAVEGRKREYLTVPLSRGLEQIQRQTAKSVQLC